MALLVVRLLGWAMHVETGRDQPEDDTEAEDGPTVTSGDLLDAGHTDTALGFAPPGVVPAVWE